MSIDLNWDALTSGPDGEHLAATIRDFIHEKFQAVKLPRFIKSVTVHSFDFGSVPPELEIKDITNPLPDFYEENADADALDSDESDGEAGAAAADGHGGGALSGSTAMPEGLRAAERRRREEERRGGAATSGGSVGGSHLASGPVRLNTAAAAAVHGPHGSQQHQHPHDLSSPFFGVATPGILGPSNLHYFQSHLASGWSGTQTPLAAVAGAHHFGPGGWQDGGEEGAVSSSGGEGQTPSHSRNPSQSSISVGDWSPAPPGDTSMQGGQPHAQAEVRQQGGAQGLPRGLGYGPGQGQGGQNARPRLREKSSVSTLAASRPPTRDAHAAGSAIAEDDEDADLPAAIKRSGPDAGATLEALPLHLDDGASTHRHHQREPRVEDVQAVFRIRYAGDIKLLLTADLLLDYPMPSFVGIPVRLSITGLTFDGVGVLAHIRKRLHFCFLGPDDALAAVGPDDQEYGHAKDGTVSGHGVPNSGAGSSPGETRSDSPALGLGKNTKFGGLLQEIRVESEIGQREQGKQSLKNVGKVERFVLEQVRRIFEDEFVYPSFWTFLV